MRATVFPEPKLEFGYGQKHPDVRFGLLNYGPLDREEEMAPREVRVGIVGTQATVERFQRYLDEIGRGIEAKESRQPNLFPRFPGFGGDDGLPAPLVTGEPLIRLVSPSAVEHLAKKNLPHQVLIQRAVELFAEEIREWSERDKAGVIVCVTPVELLRATDGSQPGPKETRYDFHDLLKAKAMQSGKTTQLVLPSTYDPDSTYRRSRNLQLPKRLQDPATRAWNLYTALYYKAGGVPWRIVRRAADYSTCYIGVSFYRTLDRDEIHSSMAQLFNERGEGVIVRGAAGEVSKEDLQPHLARVDALELMFRAITAYRREHHHAPARVVVHKSSRFLDEEREGFIKALAQERIEHYEFVWVRSSDTRLFRAGRYPPLRGTMLTLDPMTHLLYTRGSVEFYLTYPGMYVPHPVEFRCLSPESPPARIAEEMLALTKMNWNNTQFDGGLPITMVASRKVGHVLKYVPAGGRIESRYSYYM